MAKRCLNGRDEDGFTAQMRWYMKQALLLHDYDEREPEPVLRRSDNRRIRRHKKARGAEPEGGA